MPCNSPRSASPAAFCAFTALWVREKPLGFKAWPAVWVVHKTPPAPTFSLLHEYSGGRLPLYHWDLYRLGPDTDWSVLDLNDHLPSSGITVVEWPERFPGPWPQEKLIDIYLDPEDEGKRLIRVLPVLPTN
ncbi:MAG: hypothetical protein HC904_15025 [Blastochloris sp.]|nr:hypothetical protein [Blastochloris sp.]